MKKYLLLVFLILMIASIISCEKTTGGGGSSEGTVDCIDVYTPKSTDYKISAEGSDSVSVIFGLNNLSKQDLQFIECISDSVNFPGEVREEVIAVQYVHGLPIFQSNKTFLFDNDIYESPDTHPELSGYSGYTGALPAEADTTGHIPLADLRRYFLHNVYESVYTNNGNDPYTIIPDSSEYTNACLQVILGYIDGSTVPGLHLNKNSSLIKVWRITPTSSKNNLYPIVYVADDRYAAWGATPIGPLDTRLFPNFY